MKRRKVLRSPEILKKTINQKEVNMKEKIYAIRALRKAKAFVLVTDEETMMFVDMKALDSFVILVALQAVLSNLAKSVKELEVKLNERDDHGRKPRGRQKSRPVK